MPAYVVGEVEVINPDKLRDYGPAVARAVQKFGGRYLARGEAGQVLEGAASVGNVFIIEFADEQTALRWFASPEYRAAKAMRLGASNLRLVLVQGRQEPS
jgi:uncharacterized protein (DUF1330 family)